MKKFIAVLALLISGIASANPGTTYGANSTGGAYGAGSIYQVDGWKRTVLYDFCPYNGCEDGANPLPTIAKLPNGWLLGVTSEGGGYLPGSGPANGVVFILTPAATGWVYTRVMQNCSYFQDCSHYGHPVGGLAYDGVETIVGLNQKEGGEMGETWSFKLFPNYEQEVRKLQTLQAQGLQGENNVGVWKPKQRWVGK